MSMFAPAPEPKTELGRYRVLSRSAGIRVSPLVLGAMSIGEAWKSSMGSMNKEDSFKLLDAFRAAGGNFIDTAGNYQDEESETWIGEWMAARKIRDEMVIATKYTSDYRSHAVGKGGPAVNAIGNHRKNLRCSIRDSLRKLQTDYVDILYVHWWDHTVSIKEIMDGLHALVEQGKVLYLGVSDTPAWVVSAANEYAASQGKTPFSVYQGRWNLMRRDFERDIIPMARHYGMALCPWDAIGGGRFQTKAAVEERNKKGEGMRNMLGSRDEVKQSEDEARASAALEKVGKEHGVDSLTAVALAYVMAKAENVYPMIGGRKVEHLMDNIKGLSIELTEEQIKELEAATKFDVGFPGNFIGPDPATTGHSGLLFAAAQMSFPNRRK